MLACKECTTENKQKNFYLILETVGVPLQVPRDVTGGANTVGGPLKIPRDVTGGANHAAQNVKRKQKVISHHL